MVRGITFEIPNDYGQHLADILKPSDITALNWLVEPEESYLVADNQLDIPFFPDEQEIIDGSTMHNLINSESYYLIFVDVKGFPKGKNAAQITMYEEFVNSDCELIVLIADCSYTTIYCKNEEVTRKLYKNALELEYGNLEYITDENDGRTRMRVW
ncbi:DUF2691 family protein [Ectobacillus panaciterrae]|uniref:DUF2691 family protein n=1 Tax=Ectobacillus panaciterrae TaxID=363872 RepID=UPI000427BB10|nr:DUF2691 family protein [Ectobacillus panaciterrae]